MKIYINDYDFQIIRSKRKSLAIVVNSEGRVVVRSPNRLSEKTIQDFVTKKDTWIKRSIVKQLKKQEQIALRFSDSKSILELKSIIYPEFILSDFLNLSKKKVFKVNFLKLIEEKINVFLPFLSLQHQKYSLEIKSGVYKSFWGNCRQTKPKTGSFLGLKNKTSKITLTFNEILVFLPEIALDYVICHELVHIRHMNHSAEFWQTLESIYPKIKAAKAELKKINLKLMVDILKTQSHRKN